MSRLIPAVVLLVCWEAVPDSAATISGTVTDAAGKPIVGAHIDHTNRLTAPGATQTDADGHFRVTTSLPAIVIRSPGYESQRLLVTVDEQVRITLRPIKSLSKCRLLSPPQVQMIPANDVDYAANWYSVETKSGPKGVIAGRGQMYSVGVPSDSQVWTSVEYAEVMYASGTVDAVGRTQDGNYWRSKTIFGAAARYGKVDRETAEILDCIMDRIPLDNLFAFPCNTPGGPICDDIGLITEPIHAQGSIDLPLLYALDLDEGRSPSVIAGENRGSPPIGKNSDSDIWLDAGTKGEVYLNPLNGAELASHADISWNRNGCLSATYSAERVRIDGLPLGSRVCVKTNVGRNAQVMFYAGTSATTSKVKLTFVTWGGDADAQNRPINGK